LKTGFYADEDTLHEARIARLHNERAVQDGEETWRSRLTAHFHALLASTTVEEIEHETAALRVGLLTLVNEAQIEAEAARLAPPPAPEQAPLERAIEAVRADAAELTLKLASRRSDEDELDNEAVELEDYPEETPSAFDPDPIEEGNVCAHGYPVDARGFAGPAEDGCPTCRVASKPWDPDYSDDMQNISRELGLSLKE
jgi:hypothetical protein